MPRQFALGRSVSVTLLGVWWRTRGDLRAHLTPDEQRAHELDVAVHAVRIGERLEQARAQQAAAAGGGGHVLGSLRRQ